MFNTIWHALRDEFGMPEMESIMSAVKELTSHFTEDYFKDQNAVNAAIDAVCQLLQDHKDVNNG